MTYHAYFIGGPEDLTKRVFPGVPPWRYEVLEASPPLRTTFIERVPVGHTVQAYRHRYEMLRVGSSHVRDTVVYLYAGREFE